MREQLADRACARSRAKIIFVFGDFLRDGDRVFANGAKTRSHIFGAIVIHGISPLSLSKTDCNHHAEGQNEV